MDHASHVTRVLRWTFRGENDEAVVCELGLTGYDREYELRVPAKWNPTHREVERFDDALTAFQRHAMIERIGHQMNERHEHAKRADQASDVQRDELARSRGFAH